MEFTVTLPDKTLTVNIDNTIPDHSIKWTEGEIQKEIILKNPEPNFNGKEVIVNYVVNVIKNNVILSTTPENYTISNIGGEYDKWYDFNAPESLGVTLAKHLINGILFRKFGFRIFNEYGVFIQPTFEA